MTTSFIPSFHLRYSPEKKLTKEWCNDVIGYCYYNTHNVSLLDGKKVKEIEEYASGQIDMRVFKKLFKSTKKKMMDGMGNDSPFQSEEDDLQYPPLPMITTPLNSAIAILQNKPVEISCWAYDPLAATKKKEDVTFLKNKPKIENDLAEITSQMNIEPIDLGATEHSAIPFSNSPYGIDLNDQSDEEVFVNVLYKLGVETSFETVLQAWYEIKKIGQIKLLEITDQFKFGVSVNRCFDSSITGMPDAEYVYPGSVYSPKSDLPDYEDRPHDYEVMSVTPMQLFNYFGNEICDEEELEKVVIGGGNGDNKYGYCACNGLNGVSTSNWDNFKVQLLRFEVKSIDWVGVMSNPKSKKGFTALTNEEDSPNCTDKIWGQNTYVFYWVKNTKYFFNIHRLGYAHRTQGLESYQNFSKNIYRSQKKSAVENSIGENKAAQIASIKMNYEIIKSKPTGGYVDIKYIRNAMQSLTDDASSYTIDELIEKAVTMNIMIGDSSGFDGANAAQFKPFTEIVGGLNFEKISGYMRVILGAQQNIAMFTGINQSLTGQSTDKDALIGVEKIRTNAAINALSYANDGIEMQYQKLMNIWGYAIKAAVKKGGKPKEAVVAIVGERKADIIKRLDELPLHNIGIKFTLTQREEEREEYRQRVYKLEAAGVLNSADIYMLKYIPNIKDRFALLAVRENNFQKRQEAIRQQQAAQQQQLMQQQGQNMVAKTEAEKQGEKEIVFAKGETAAQLQLQKSQLDNNSKKSDAQIQAALQTDRNQGQIEKLLRGITAKSIAEQQKSLA